MTERDGRHGKRGDQVATNVPTYERTNVLPTEGAAAPIRVSDVVTEYAKIAARVGWPPKFETPGKRAEGKAALAGQVLRLFRDEWPRELVLHAVMDAAERKKNPYYVAEWIRLAYAAENEKAHLDRKRGEPKDGGLRAIAAAMKGVGL